jgi:hypothetical protein
LKVVTKEGIKVLINVGSLVTCGHSHTVGKEVLDGFEVGCELG